MYLNIAKFLFCGYVPHFCHDLHEAVFDKPFCVTATIDTLPLAEISSIKKDDGIGRRAAGRSWTDHPRLNIRWLDLALCTIAQTRGAHDANGEDY